MIINSITILNNPVRANGGIVVLWHANSDTAGRMVVSNVDSLDYLNNVNTTYAYEVPEGSSSFIQAWSTAPATVGTHNLIVGVYTDLNYTTLLESYTIPFEVSNRQYQIDNNLTFAEHPGVGYVIAGEVDIYERGKALDTNGIIEYVTWDMVYKKNGIQFSNPIDTPPGSTGGNGRYPFSLFIPAFTDPGSYTITIGALSDDGYPLDAQGPGTTLTSSTFGPIVVS